MHTQKSKRGFTLAELVVVGAVAGMAFTLMAPAMQKGREDLNRRRCENNLRQLGVAMHSYANVNGGLPPMALAWSNAQYTQLHSIGAPGNWHDGHGWYSLIAPYIGQPAWASTIDYTRSMSAAQNDRARRGGLRLKLHACPADIGLQRNEWNTVNWARVRSNYVANAGNTNYGQTTLNGTPFLGAPFAGGATTPLASITDGLSNTLLMSEVVVLPETTPFWPGAYSETQTALGGHVFTGYNPPNSNAPDAIGYGRIGQLSPAAAAALFAQQGIPVPVQAPTGFSDAAKATYIAPRSKHPEGINASMCDGSVGFIANGIDPAVWRALSTAHGADSTVAAPAEVEKRRTRPRSRVAPRDI